MLHLVTLTIVTVKVNDKTNISILAKNTDIKLGICHLVLTPALGIDAGRPL